jgi:cytochrome c5
MADQHQSPIKTPKQLSILIVLAFAIPIAIALIVSQFVTTGRKPLDPAAQEQVAERIKPVARVAVAGGAPQAAAVPAGGYVERSGEEIVRAQCFKCHETGEMGAPKIGDKQAWAPRVSRGLDAVTKSAIHGHGNMPARGGMADLTDAELTKAIIYMLNASGHDTQAAPAQAAAPAAAPAAAADGKTVYEKTCVACHAAAVAGAPKLGDKAAWAPRIATGADALVKSAIAGKGAMPPKGGNTALSDAEIKAAVEYMVAQAK